jgi:hypothetical protein
LHDCFTLPNPKLIDAHTRDGGEWKEGDTSCTPSKDFEKLGNKNSIKHQNRGPHKHLKTTVHLCLKLLYCNLSHLSYLSNNLFDHLYFSDLSDLSNFFNFFGCMATISDLSNFFSCMSHLSDLSDLSNLSDFFSCQATCSPLNSVNHWELVQANGTGIVTVECPRNKFVLGCGIRRGKYICFQLRKASLDNNSKFRL